MRLSAPFFGSLFEWTGGTLRLDVEEIFADEDHGVVLVRESATGRKTGHFWMCAKPTCSGSGTGKWPNSGTCRLPHRSQSTTTSSLRRHSCRACLARAGGVAAYVECPDRKPCKVSANSPGAVWVAK